jgi:hypothetical protein
VRNPLRKPAPWVFLILLGSDAFFWHTRDWNTASRLMLTYSLVDRGTVVITGLDGQTGDKARFQGQYYSDKLPGFSLLSTLPYFLSKQIVGLPSHPLNEVRARAYWAADYWVTLFTSGLLTACTGALLVYWSRCLGCRPWPAALLGLAYGLATPAYVYATLANGHQLSAFALFTSFFLLWKKGPRRRPGLVFFAGFLAAYAAVVELYVGPASAILGLYVLFECIARKRRIDDFAIFCVGAAIPTLILLGYNQLAFGSPWQMGYFHHATQQFHEVHNDRNPLGLSLPESFMGRLGSLLWGRHRGLTFYAPILLLTVPGWIALVARRRSSVASITFLVAVSVLLVNVFYPEWTGGWSTGPRLLVPLLPFAVLPIAGLLAGGTTFSRSVTWLAAALALAGAIEMLLFQGVDGRVPHTIADPLIKAVWPLWNGQPLPGWRYDERFCCNLTMLAAPEWVAGLSPRWQVIQFLPVLFFQAAGIIGLWRFGLDNQGNAPRARNVRRANALPLPQTAASNLGIDQQQERRRDGQQSEDAQAQANRA